MGMTAIATGKVIAFVFNSNDPGGASYGCGIDNCRRQNDFFLLK